MEMNECYVIGAGEFYGLAQRPEKNSFVIAADGGYRYCEQEGLIPDLLLGDFDSLGEVPVFEQIMRVPVEKDDTDTMLALRVGLEKGCRVFHIYGGTGGRLDHTLANLQALAFLANRGATGFLYDDGFVYTVITERGIAVGGKKEDILSVFALGGAACGVTISGVQYPLSDAELQPDFPLGVSNHFVEDTAIVRVTKGMLAIGWQIHGAIKADEV